MQNKKKVIKCIQRPSERITKEWQHLSLIMLASHTQYYLKKLLDLSKRFVQANCNYFITKMTPETAISSGYSDSITSTRENAPQILLDFHPIPIEYQATILGCQRPPKYKVSTGKNTKITAPRRRSYLVPHASIEILNRAFPLVVHEWRFRVHRFLKKGILVRLLKISTVFAVMQKYWLFYFHLYHKIYISQ